MAKWLNIFRRCLWLVLATGLASCPATAWTDEPGFRAIPAPLAEEAIEEILRLRRLLGTDQALPGVTRDGGAATPDDQFRQALRALIARPAAAEPEIASPDPPRRVEAPERLALPAVDVPHPLERTRIRRSAALEDEAVPDSAAADLAVVGSLRDTSRLLDNRAHDLDAEQRFDEAAKLRQLAARLRKDARRIERTR